MRVRTFIVFPLLLGALVGCGGGGGSSTATIQYQTTWTGRGGRASGASQAVKVYDSTGALVQQSTLNQAGPAAQFLTFSGLAVGTYRVHAELLDGPNATGTVTGRLDSILTVSTGATGKVTSEVGGTVTSVAVTPSNPAIALDSTLTFGVAGVVADGSLTFLTPASIQWSSNSTGIPIDASGVATAKLPGSATITARDADSTQTASTTATVPSPPRSTWTIMVYLDAANDLQPYSLLNMNQMELLGGGANVRFVVQWKQLKIFSGSTFDGTRRYLVNQDSDQTAVKSQMVQDLGTNVDMGNAQTMRDFIDWATVHYPSDHTMLIMWDHGNGWVPRKISAPKTRAIHFDDQFGTVMSLPSIRSALQGVHLDVISMDACLMQQVEIAAELKLNADYILTSEDLTPGPGYLYDACFRSFFTTPTASVKTLLQSVCDNQVGDPRYATTAVTQSIVDSSKVDGLASALDNLAGVLIANVSSMGPTMASVRAKTYRTDTANPAEFYYDLGDLMTKFIQDANCPNAVKLAAGGVQTALAAAVPYAVHSKDFPAATGITVDLTPGRQYQPSVYGTLQFAQNTRWGQWLAVAP